MDIHPDDLNEQWSQTLSPEETEEYRVGLIAVRDFIILLIARIAVLPAQSGEPSPGPDIGEGKEILTEAKFIAMGRELVDVLAKHELLFLVEELSFFELDYNTHIFHRTPESFYTHFGRLMLEDDKRQLDHVLQFDRTKTAPH